MQAFRKAIGVRIKEETEILEGEVRFPLIGHAIHKCLACWKVLACQGEL